MPELVTQVARDGAVHEGVQTRARNPAHPDRAVSIKAFPLPGGRVGVSVEDITASVKVLRMQAAGHKMLEGITAGDPLPEVLATLTRALEAHFPPARCTIRPMDSGSPAVEVESRGRWAWPIVNRDGRELGLFALEYPDPRSPTVEDLEVIERARYLAGIAIERRQLEDQLRELSAHVESIREDERTGIAREIHDDLGQALTALKMDLAWLGRRLADGRPEDGSVLRERIQGMSDLTDAVIERVRRISAELRPGVLDDLGLLAAFEWQGQEFEQRTEATCSIRSNFGDERLDPAVSTAVFRIFQEALTNVARHARAHHVDVTLVREDGHLTMTVQDDGVGIPAEAGQSLTALGLLGMRERARRLGGTASVLPAEEGGTVVRVRVPLAGGPR